MKNLINYYYNLLITDFRKIDDYFLFEVDNVKYEFLFYDGNINNLYRMYLLLKSRNKYCHEIIINKDNSIITFYENKPYILIKKNIFLKNRVTLEEILSYDIGIIEDHEFNWKELWKSKIDYYEYQMSQLGFKYKILKESFSYYIGISETAITLLNYMDNKKINNYICHNRIKYKEDMDEFLNPINIIIDNRTRDIAAYFKINYINDNITTNEVINYLDKINLDYNESILLMARLIYPSYYFDMYDSIIQGKVNEEKINFYIKKNVYYETFLKQIYKYLKYRYRIPQIEWLEANLYL